MEEMKKMSKLQISKEEYENRRKDLLKQMEGDLDAICLFNPTHIFYLTNFGYLQTERPIAYILTEDNDACMFIPALEQDRIEEVGYVEKKQTYPDYPGKKHPMKHLKALFEELGLEDKVIGVDAPAPPGVMGYEGADLEEILSEAVIKKEMGQVLREEMMVKSKAEIRLIKKSAEWGATAHWKLQEFTEVGLNETYISNKASLEASMEMIESLGKKYRAIRNSNAGAFAGFRGQVGKHSALPHSVSINATIQKGDVLVTGASSYVGGYLSELERTLIIGEPTQKQKNYFRLMKEAQEVAFETIEAGIKCSKVDKRVREFFRDKGIMDYWRHHTGHSLGLNGHEPPFFDIGDETKLKPGMIMSVEPGIYIPGMAGFRHSDTVLVTEDGMEKLTAYPRTLAELTVPV